MKNKTPSIQWHETLQEWAVHGDKNLLWIKNGDGKNYLLNRDTSGKITSPSDKSEEKSAKQEAKDNDDFVDREENEEEIEQQMDKAPRERAKDMLKDIIKRNDITSTEKVKLVKDTLLNGIVDKKTKQTIEPQSELVKKTARITKKDTPKKLYDFVKRFKKHNKGRWTKKFLKYMLKASRLSEMGVDVDILELLIDLLF